MVFFCFWWWQIRRSPTWYPFLYGKLYINAFRGPGCTVGGYSDQIYPTHKKFSVTIFRSQNYNYEGYVFLKGQSWDQLCVEIDCSSIIWHFTIPLWTILKQISRQGRLAKNQSLHETLRLTCCTSNCAAHLQSRWTGNTEWRSIPRQFRFPRKIETENLTNKIIYFQLTP